MSAVIQKSDKLGIWRTNRKSIVGDGFPVPPHTSLGIPGDGKPVPYEWMTINSPKFDGDSHEVVRYFIAMTVLFGAPTSLAKFQFVALLRKSISK